MTAKELFTYTLDQATAVVVQVEPDKLSLATPDTDWDVHALLAHMLYELAWVADIVAGKTIAEVGDSYEGDLLADDIAGNWRRYAKIATAAVEACDEKATAHLSYADVPVEDYLWEVANDLLIHGWDLGQGIGVSVIFDETVAGQLYEKAAAHQAELTASGMYAPPIPVSAGANIQTKLLAVLGRSEDWVDVKNT